MCEREVPTSYTKERIKEYFFKINKYLFLLCTEAEELEKSITLRNTYTGINSKDNNHNSLLSNSCLLNIDKYGAESLNIKT